MRKVLEMVDTVHAPINCDGRAVAEDVLVPARAHQAYLHRRAHVTVVVIVRCEAREGPQCCAVDVEGLVVWDVYRRGR